MNEYVVKYNQGLKFPDWKNTNLFSRNQYFLLFKNYELHQFQLETQLGNPVARLNLAFYSKTALNPLLAPFGGVEIVEDLEEESLVLFLNEVERLLTEKGLDFIRITQLPEAYEYNSYKIIESAFKKAGFERQERLPNWIFFIQEPNLQVSKVVDYELDFVFEDEFDLKEIFEFIQANRIKQGYDFRLGFDDFYGFFTALPEFHSLFALEHNGKIIAVLTGILVKDDCFYAFPAAYDPQEATFDQILFFYQYLFELLKENGFKIFDVGTVFNDQDKLIFSQLNPVKTYKNTFSKEL